MGMKSIGSLFTSSSLGKKKTNMGSIRTRSLWIQSMTTKYLHNSNLLNSKQRTTDSLVWENILRS